MKKMFMFSVIFLWSMSAAADNFSWAGQDNYVVQMGGSSMDWTMDVITSGGSSIFSAEGESTSHRAMVAEREARFRALKNLHDSIGETYLDSSTTINHVRSRNPGVTKDFAAMVQQATVVDRVMIPVPGGQNLVEAFVMLDLWDEQTRFFMPGFLFAPVETGDFQDSDSLLSGDCVINIDAAGLGVSPAIIPSITDKHGNMLLRASTLGSGRKAGRSNISYIRSSSQEPGFRTIQSQGQITWIKAERALGEHGTDIGLNAEGSDKFIQVISSSRDDCSINIILK